MQGFHQAFRVIHVVLTFLGFLHSFFLRFGSSLSSRAATRSQVAGKENGNFHHTTARPNPFSERKTSSQGSLSSREVARWRRRPLSMANEPVPKFPEASA